MSEFSVFRHGRIDRAQRLTTPDPGLSDQGRLDAAAAAGALAPDVCLVYTSPLRRAAETAALLGPPVVREPRVRERMNFGDLPGQSRETFLEIWNRCCREPDWQPPAGDGSAQAARRFEDFLREAAARHPDQHVAVVTHGGILADFLRHAFDPKALETANPGFATDPYDGTVVRECSLTRLELNPDGETDCLTLLSVAETAHLGGEQTHE